MRILVDADACPVKDIIVRLARQRGYHVIMVCDTSHIIRDGYSQVVTVDKGRDSVDLVLANQLRPSDIVVTQDYGVAALALGKGCRTIGNSGLEYSGANIDQLLFERHLGQKVRRAGGRAGSTKKRSAEDDAKFEETYLRVLDAEL